MSMIRFLLSVCKEVRLLLTGVNIAQHHEVSGLSSRRFDSPIHSTNFLHTRTCLFKLETRFIVDVYLICARIQCQVVLTILRSAWPQQVTDGSDGCTDLHSHRFGVAEIFC